MTGTVTFPVDLGGDGSTVTDDGNPSTGLANGGHRTRFVPAMANTVAMAQKAADSAAMTVGAFALRNGLYNGGFEVWQRYGSDSASISCPAGSRTYVADCWYVNPSGAAIVVNRSTNNRTGKRCHYGHFINGAASVTQALLGQRIPARVPNHVLRSDETVTFSGYIYNNSGSAMVPQLLIGAASALNNFGTVNNQITQNLQSCADNAYTLVSHTFSMPSACANGMQVEIKFPGANCASGDIVGAMELALYIGDTAIPFEPRDPIIELALCEQFFEKSFKLETKCQQNAGVNTGESTWRGIGAGATQVGSGEIRFRTRKFAVSTMTLYSPNAASAQVLNISGGLQCTSSSAICNGETGFRVDATGNATGTSGQTHGVHWSADCSL